uniref:dTDP-4-dehydrorhamnose 3,5-epimerase n=1 Tax=Magnetococcus massalia (strain MO-1) TaxID=451514 RepID=A0A1S7LJF4_MAGMO|nr:dTDP-4-dehydrorhamnose 3,5-epimerase related [Candidatus Magnetococcus massalia]
MRFIPLQIAGAFVIELEPMGDARGHFARTYCERTFAAAGLHTHWRQSSLSHNRQRGTLRGMHYQCAPHGEIKLVRCLAGSLFDVICDMRQGSPTYGQWQGVTLTSGAHNGVYLPRGVAHGFQTLEPETVILYQMSDEYAPDATAGFHWCDPAVGIAWPLDEAILSSKDSQLPSLVQARPIGYSFDEAVLAEQGCRELKQ